MSTVCCPLIMLPVTSINFLTLYSTPDGALLYFGIGPSRNCSSIFHSANIICATIVTAAFCTAASKFLALNLINAISYDVCLLFEFSSAFYPCFPLVSACLCLYLSSSLVVSFPPCFWCVVLLSACPRPLLLARSSPLIALLSIFPRPTLLAFSPFHHSLPHISLSLYLFTLSALILSACLLFYG